MLSKVRFPERKTLLIFLALILISLPIFFMMQPASNLSLLAVSSVNLRQQGSASASGEWTGSYWLITLVTDTLDHIEGLKYDFSNKEVQSSNTVLGNQLVVKSNITIIIYPKTPFYERAVKYVEYVVYPETHGTYINKLNTANIGKTDAFVSLTARVIEFDPLSSWVLHTPFDIFLYKNGNLKDRKLGVDTVGGTVAFTMTGDSPEETLLIQNLGKIGTGLYPPSWQMIYLDNFNIFLKEGEIVNEIKYDMIPESYSNYWFGGGNLYTVPSVPGTPNYVGYVVRRWTDGSPAHYVLSTANVALWTGWFPGSYRADDSLNDIVVPISADIFNDKAANTPVSGAKAGLSLTNYLQNNRGHKKYTLFELNNLQSYGIGVTAAPRIDTSRMKMQLYLPLASFSNLLTLRLSTELADAIVYVVHITQGDITEVKWISGASHVDISTVDYAYVTVKNIGTSAGKVTISADTADLPISLTSGLGSNMDAAILNPGESKVFIFTVKNLGTLADKNNNVITFTVTNDNGEVTDTATLTFDLLKQTGATNTLAVLVADTDGKAVSGINVILKYGSKSDLGLSDAGVVHFNLDTYLGPATISSTATSEYLNATKNITITAGANSEVLIIQRISEPQLDWLQYLLQYWYLIPITAGVIVAAVVLAKRKSPLAIKSPKSGTVIKI